MSIYCFSSRGFGFYLSRHVEHLFGHFSHVRTEVTATKGAIKVMVQIRQAQIIIACFFIIILISQKISRSVNLPKSIRVVLES